jgi:peptidyl-prolyl cis-trans isomerase D
MLRVLRENASNIIIQVLFAIIVVVFIFMIPGMGAQQGRQTVVTVDGEPIDQTEFQRAFRNRLAFYQQAGQNLTEEQMEQMRDATLQQLIDQRLLLAEAERRGYRVSDSEVMDQIRRQEIFFGEDEVFSTAIYEDYLERNGIARHRYEMDVRESMALQRIQSMVRRTITVSPGEVEDAWRTRNDTVNLEFVRVPALRFEGQVDVSEEAVNAYMAGNMGEIQKRYEDRKDTEYTHDREARARHILLKVGADDSDEKKAELRSRLEDIRKEAIGGADFTELARKFSEDPGSANKGGDLGYFVYERMVPEFSAAAFGQGPGDLSEIVETSFGLHVVLTEDIREARVDKFPDVKADIAADLLREEKAPALAADMAEGLRASFESGGDITTELGIQNLRMDETGEFGADVERIPKIGLAPEILAWATGTSESGETMGRVVVSDGNAYLVRVKERSVANMDDFDDDARSELTRELLSQKRSEWDAAFRQGLRDRAKIRINS